MDELRDLQQMASLASGRFKQYDGEDFVLPDIFKEQVKEINSNSITYNKYSAIIETKGSQHGGLNIFMPNQWFYIASYFTDFYNEIQKYKRYALKVTTKERLKELSGGELTDVEQHLLNQLNLGEGSKKNLKKFITDYTWWGGAKTIDRGDFYVSPILSNANLVNASQTFIAELCAFLANKQDLVQTIINKGDSGYLSTYNKTLLGSPCIEGKEGISGFLDIAIPYVLERDSNLSRLDIYTNINSNTFLTVGKFSLGRIAEKEARPKDTNPKIAWICGLNNKEYNLYREVTYPIFASFVEIFNKAYKGDFEIVIDTVDCNGTERKRYSLYSIGSSEFSVPSIPFSCTPLIEKIKSTGLIYSDELIKRFAYALMTKPFVILSGLAGSGKTQLALAFAECMSEDIARQVRVVSVGADWTNREPLLGYPNALKSNEYVMPECGALDLLIEANENPNRPYFLILDEMNLSVVERYFADFLSAMESKKPIALWKGTSNEECERPVPHEIMLPKNLYIIGTINVDETTYMFSPKVLDRANVIEFKIAAGEMESFLEADKMVDRSVCHSGCADMAQDFLERTNTSAIGTDTSAVQEVLNGFFKELKSVNAEFGYRTASEIYRYINNVGNDLGDHGAVDTAILQKLLPKLHGSRKKLSPVLSALWKLCFAEESGVAIESVKDFANVEGLIYKNSAEKILRMYKAVVDNGFTSFAEA